MRTNYGSKMRKTDLKHILLTTLSRQSAFLQKFHNSR
jgi:hypothetical protein